MQSWFKHPNRTVLGIFISIVMFMFSSPAPADTPDDDEVRTRGYIQSIGTDSLVVNNRVFWVNENTRVKSEHHMHIGFSDLKVGDYVEIEAIVLDDGRYLAREIELQQDPGDMEIEVEGFITALGRDSLVVEGITFFVDPNTMIQGEHHTPLSFSDLQVGDYVEVKGVLQPDSTLLATRIKVKNRMKMFEIKGFIEAIGSDTLVVNGWGFRVDSSTRIVDDEGESIPFDQLQVGYFVEVKAERQPDGTYLARTIELEDFDDDYMKMELEGFVQEVGPNYLKVNSMQIYVDSNTVIQTDDDALLPFSEITVNMFVEVEAVRLMDGTLLAKKIEVKREDDYSDEFEIKGRIDDLGIDSTGTRYIVVRGLTFYLNDQTTIEGRHHRPLDFSDLSVGLVVEVEAQRQANGSYLALKIKVKNDQWIEIELTAPIDTLYENVVVVTGIAFQTDSSTEIYGRHRTPLTFNDLRPGMIVTVKGYRLQDGSFYAYRIKVEELWREKIEFEAVIDSVGLDWIALLGQKVYVTDSTQIYDESKNPVDFSYLQAGQWVEVKALIQPDGRLIAIKIKVEDNNRVEIEIHATIDTLYANIVRAGGIDFLVDNTTDILNESGAPITLGELSVGMVVEIKAVQEQNGSYRALRIKVEDDPNVNTVAGTVSGLSGDQLVVGNSNIDLTPQTVILDQNFNPITIEQLNLGDPVTVWTDYSDPANPQAVQVQQGGTDSVTGLDDGSLTGIPTRFELGQNYPNPFNPSTTIPVTLAGNQWQKVQLIVYNILGQKVRTLFDGVLQGGKYQFQWNGRNDQGQLLPSGIYFYRLTVNQQPIQTRRMIFLK